MAIRLNSVSTRIIFYYLLMMLVLLPAFFFAVVWATRASMVNGFVSHVRSYSKTVAETLESRSFTEQEIVTLLDSVILSGDGVYAHFHSERAGHISSSISDIAEPPPTDFGFGDQNDSVYYVSLLINNNSDPNAQLILGFDELNTLEAISRLTGLIFALVMGIGTLSVGFLALIAARLTRPLKQIQLQSADVTSGNLNQPIEISAGLYEIDQLATNLEAMRSQLVGKNRQLEAEMAARLREAEAREALELQLEKAHHLEALGTMAGGVAHEINNLLLPMKLNLEMAEEDASEDSVRQMIRSTLKSVDRAEDVVKNMLLLARTQNISPTGSTNLNALISEACRLVQPTLPDHVKLELEVPDSALYVEIDGSLLHQVLVNLIKNALQAMQVSGGSLCVSAQLCTEDYLPFDVDPEKDYVVIRVRDTGEGMPQSVIERATDPFFSTRSAGAGSGLGLSIVSGIVRSVRGYIHISSQQNSGTTVSVYIPLSTASGSGL